MEIEKKKTLEESILEKMESETSPKEFIKSQEDIESLSIPKEVIEREG